VFSTRPRLLRQLRWERNRLVRFEKWLTQTTIEEELADARVSSALELGCGGTWTGLLADRAERVLAVDLSESMLGQAREAMAQRFQRHADSVRHREVQSRFGEIRPDPERPGAGVRSEWQPVVEGLGRWLSPGGRAVVVTKTPISIWRGTGRERWFGPRTFARRLTGRSLNPDFWQKYIPVRSMVQAFRTAGLVDITVRPVIFGLPIFMRGTKQYRSSRSLPSSRSSPRAGAHGSGCRRRRSRRMAALPLADPTRCRVASRPEGPPLDPAIGPGRVRQSLGGEGGAGGSHTPSAVTTTLSNATGSFASSPTAPLLNVESLTRSICVPFTYAIIDPPGIATLKLYQRYELKL